MPNKVVLCQVSNKRRGPLLKFAKLAKYGESTASKAYLPKLGLSNRLNETNLICKK